MNAWDLPAELRYHLRLFALALSPQPFFSRDQILPFFAVASIGVSACLVGEYFAR